MIVATKLVAVKRGEVSLIKEELPPLDNNGLLIRTLMSAISHATELGVINRTTPTFYKKWLSEYRVYSKEGSTKKYPASLGYENVGEIIDVGRDVKEFKKGDIVWTDSPHQDFVIVSAIKNQICKLPSKEYLKRGLFIALTRVALTGIRDAKLNIGDRVAVFGLGTIGLLTIQLAALATQEKVYTVEPIKRRRILGKKLNAFVFDLGKEDAALRIHELTDGYGVDAVIETSGNTKALHEAIRSCRMGGRVVTVGTYRQDSRHLHLAEEWHRNRIELISSMSVNGCPSRDYPRWDLYRLNKTASELLIHRKVMVEDLITHTFPFKHAVKAYKLLAAHPEKTVKIVFSYE